jgi:hypothetical protein
MIKLLDLTNTRHQLIVAEEIARAKRIIKESNSPKFSGIKVAEWMKNNSDLLADYSYTSGGGTKNVRQIIDWLETDRASQYYIKGLIDDMDLIAGVAIDDEDFYEDPPKPAGGSDIWPSIDPRSIFPNMPLD